MTKLPNGVEPYSELVEICEKVSIENKWIKSFFLHGSRVTNRHHDDSDLDMVFIVDDLDKTSTLKELLLDFFEVKQVGMYYLRGLPWELWTWKGKEVGVHIYSENEVLGKVNNLYSSIDSFELISPWVQHTVREMFVVMDKDEILIKALDKVNQFPGDFFSTYRQSYLDFLRDRVEWMILRPYWKGIAEEVLDSAQIYEYIIRCHYAFNPEIGFYMPGAKNYSFDAPLMKPEIKEEMSELLKQINIDNELLLRNKRIQREIIDQIRKKFENGR